MQKFINIINELVALITDCFFVDSELVGLIIFSVVALGSATFFLR